MDLVDKTDFTKLEIGEVMSGGYCNKCGVNFLIKRTSKYMWTMMCSCSIHFIGKKGFVKKRGLDKEEYEEYKKWKKSIKG